MKRLTLSLFLSAFISAVVLGWLIDAYDSEHTQRQGEFALASPLVKGLTRQLAAVPEEERVGLSSRLSSQFDVTITLLSEQDVALPEPLVAELKTQQSFMLEDDFGVYMLATHPQLWPQLIEVRLGESMQKDRRLDALLTLMFYLGVCFFMAFTLWPLTRRLAILSDVAKQFANGDFNARVSPSFFSYTRDLENTFNRMASQISQLLAENKLLASSLSHDIRTPIACLRFGLDAAIESPDAAKKDHYLQRMESDLVQMEQMLKSYLEYATLERYAHQLSYSSAPCLPYLESVTEQIAPKLNDKGLHLSLDANDFTLHADLHWLARAITNLLSNACDFAKTQIHVRAEHTQFATYIHIEDDGPGIPHEKRHQVFDPFYQEDNHRNRAKNNFGLGLAIVAKVADWHYGSVKVGESEHLGGAHFTLVLPHKTPPSLTTKNDSVG